MSAAAASPSFTGAACQRAGRVLLPVAGRSPARRRFGEPQNPGRALAPREALQWLDRMLADGVAVSAVGIGGPGDPLADPAPALETLRGVRAAHPELALTLSTLGLCPAPAEGGPSMDELAAGLAEIGVSQATLLVDAVDPAIVEKLFAWIRPGRRTLPLTQAAVLLVDAQAQAIRRFREAGLYVTVAMTVYAGVNEHHVEDVASVVASLGADMLALAPFVPAATAATGCGCPASADAPCPPAACAACGTAASCPSKAPAAPAPVDEPEIPELPPLAPGRLAELREAARRYIPVAPEGDPCGQDVTWAESLGQADPSGAGAALRLDNPAVPRPAPGRPNVAVASSGGLEVDLHLGQAIRFLIYGPRTEDGLPSLLGLRDAPEPGPSTGGGRSGDARWNALADTLSDCFAVLASSVGQNPRRVLAERGITVLTTEADVQAAVDALYGGGKKPKRRIKAD